MNITKNISMFTIIKIKQKFFVTKFLELRHPCFRADKKKICFSQKKLFMQVAPENN